MSLDQVFDQELETIVHRLHEEEKRSLAGEKKLHTLCSTSDRDGSLFYQCKSAENQSLLLKQSLTNLCDVIGSCKFTDQLNKYRGEEKIENEEEPVNMTDPGNAYPLERLQWAINEGMDEIALSSFSQVIDIPANISIRDTINYLIHTITTIQDPPHGKCEDKPVPCIGGSSLATGCTSLLLSRLLNIITQNQGFESYHHLLSCCAEARVSDGAWGQNVWICTLDKLIKSDILSGDEEYPRHTLQYFLSKKTPVNIPHKPLPENFYSTYTPLTVPQSVVCPEQQVNVDIKNDKVGGIEYFKNFLKG